LPPQTLKKACAPHPKGSSGLGELHLPLEHFQERDLPDLQNFQEKACAQSPKVPRELLTSPSPSSLSSTMNSLDFDDSKDYEKYPARDFSKWYRYEPPSDQQKENKIK